MSTLSNWALRVFFLFFFISLTFLILKNRSQGIGFSVLVDSQGPGVLRIFYDGGSGFLPQNVIKAPFNSEAERLVSVRIPVGSLSGLRMEFDYAGGQIALHSLSVHASEVHEMNPLDFREINDISRDVAEAGHLKFSFHKVGENPYLVYKLDPSFVASYERNALVFRSVLWGMFFYLLALLGSFFVRRIICSRLTRVLMKRSEVSPRWAMFIFSLILLLVSSYPVILFNRSFVSPHNGPAAMYYCEAPTIPFDTHVEVENTRGSDVGAMMWQNVPYAKIQHDAFFIDRELPLWNRYSSAGISLIGQGISQFGDILHFIPIFGNAHPWAWDLKFLLAKFLFIFGIGLVSLMITNHLGASLLSALAASLVGFFAWRFNHPAFFAFCYSPWILYFWFTLSRERSNLLFHVPLLALSSLSLINSGTAKEAYMFALSMHLCGFTNYLFGNRSRLVRKFLVLLLLFFLIAISHMPFVYFFVETLQESFTHSSAPSVGPYDLHAIWGLFDLTIQTQISRSYFMPSTNVLAFIGLLLFLTHVTRSVFTKEISILFAGAVFTLSLAFGIIPSSILIRIPILNQIGHTGNTFSSIFCVFALFLSAVGFREWIIRDFRKSRYVWYLVLSGFCVFWFYSYYLASIKIGIPKGLVLLFLLMAIPVVPLYLKKGIAKSSVFQILFLMTIFVITMLKTGQHLRTGIEAIDTEIPNPQHRIDYRIQWPEGEVLRDPKGQRSIGVGCTFFAGYNVLVEASSVNSPDPLIPKYFRDYIEKSIHFSNWQWRIHIDEDQFERDRNYFNFLNVKYLVKPGSNSFEFSKDVKVNDESWPLAFSTSRIFTYNTLEEFVELVKLHGQTPFLAIEKIDLSKHPYFDEIERTDSGVIQGENLTFTNNKTSFDISVEKPSIVVLHENFYEHDFIAKINGVPQIYFRINQMFKGIFLKQAGHYRIEFEYKPQWTSAAVAMLSFFGISLLVLFVLFLRKVGGSFQEL